MNSQTLLAAHDLVRQHFGDVKPSWAMILGSGWSVVLETFAAKQILPYDDIPGMGQARVQGHAGSLYLVEVGKSLGFIFAGRRHLYEGEGFTPIATPIYIAKSFGIHALLLTNAAGGINPDYHPGDLMVIDDHINMMGQSPLVGAHDPFWGPRFPDQTAVYNPKLRSLLDIAAKQSGHTLKHGIYLATLGPTYETPAEIRAYRQLGADAVGMSTIPEAILAHAAGMHVAGLSCITNLAAGVSDQALAHEEVLHVTEQVKPKMSAILGAVCQHLANLPPA
ncbi:MAG: purine-nucleoside phosphorylase [Verrucomicrobia bacterium]|nr:purine-nucleoside phosphorylase [Verrucomicrobiota bacterium]